MTTVDPIEFTGLAALTGTAREVKDRLNLVTNPQVVAFTMPRANAHEGEALAKTVMTVVGLINGRHIRYTRETMESLVNALMPTIPPPKSAIREAVMIGKARAAVLEGTEWVSASELADMAGFSASNPNAQPSRWKTQGKIFSVKPASGVELFPVFALDPHASYRPRKEMADIIAVLRDKKDGWGMAYWFTSINSFLGGKRPQDVLMTDPQKVLAAATDEVQAITHG